MSTQMAGPAAPPAASTANPNPPNAKVGFWKRMKGVLTKRPSFSLYAVLVSALVLIIGIDRIVVRLHPGSSKSSGTVVFVPNLVEIQGKPKVYDQTLTWNLQDQFYLTVPCEIKEGDYIFCGATGLTPWATSESKAAADRGYPTVTPDGVPWTPRQLKRGNHQEFFPAMDASVASLIGIIGSQPVYNKAGIAHVTGGSDYFPLRSKSCWRVEKLPKGRHFLSLAINDWWTIGEMHDNSGTWHIMIRVYRPEKG